MNCYFDYSAPKDLLKGRVIVVTGAGDGIGRSAALSFASHGATVVLMGRTTSKLEKVYDDIEQAGHPQPAIIPIHFEGATPHDYEMIAGKLEEEFGRLDGVLFNASILGLRTPISQYDTDIWAQVIQVNLNSQFYMTRALLPLLEKSTDASIVYTSSSVGRKGRAYWGAYAVSKFATEGLMQTLADELENTSSIRVNSINPGATRTSMRAYAYPAENPAEVITPEEIMPTYLYLMGADSKGTTGQAFDAQPPKV
ncbi:YciK family oxidoreductase [Pokkaliibacter plantistimulans]|uniref:YciK family oxidoreductase n=1 Tax=Proteobacteria bacterium 228 TaxID=2083153 RepID=A0A2S5KQT9_9PROT|nr:YciK family oxidoreductase [Pokkaliibacter plantistimulans]PPC77100.1 YciK family oxidoreductase [Pokkaliibacter plantistimulans]